MLISLRRNYKPAVWDRGVFIVGSFLKIFKKAGGFSVIYNYKKAHVLGVAVAQFMLLGTSKKALEILRLSAELKTHNRLKKKYQKLLKSYTVSKNELKEHPPNKVVWICWLQGLENAPIEVKCCYKSVCRYFVNWEIVLINSDNFERYTDFPDYIIDKWHGGIISNTHFSDLLRVELLTLHGGLWLDATVLCSGTIPEYICDSNLFFYQCLKPGLDGHSIRVSSWLIYAVCNNNILSAVRSMLLSYWKKENYLIDYYLLHHFLTIAMEYFPEEMSRIPKIPNDLSHILLLELFEPYDYKRYQLMKQFTSFHKLSYKFTRTDIEKKRTFYEHIIREEEL